MRAYLAFTKKELFELTKTYKLLLIVTVFLIFGFMNPVVAKFTRFNGIFDGRGHKNKFARTDYF